MTEAIREHIFQKWAEPLERGKHAVLFPRNTRRPVSLFPYLLEADRNIGHAKPSQSFVRVFYDDMIPWQFDVNKLAYKILLHNTRVRYCRGDTPLGVEAYLDAHVREGNDIRFLVMDNEAPADFQKIGTIH